MIWDSFLSQKIVYKKLKVTHLFSTIEKKTDNLPHLLSPSYEATLINRVAGQTLSRSYGRCIAEFLNEGSLVRLGLLDLSTCVGLRYGRRHPHVYLLF
jgi:predicted phosphoadenosine phosphosulfate sulfurtransferase